MRTEFISNTGDSHLKKIINLFETADEVWLATAFLKESGLTKLLPSIKKHLASKKAISIIAGQNFALTEPKALHTLRNLFDQYPEAKLYLANAINPKSVFHPKLFVFRKNEDYTIISGSANITEGGLSSNVECSLLVESAKSDNAWKEALIFYNKLISIDNAQEATLLVIKQYETFFESQKLLNKKAKSIPIRKKSEINFNYTNLSQFFKKFDTADREKMFKEKQANYKEAKQVLNSIADHPKLTEVIFASLLDKLVGSAEEYNLWHSGSVYRLRRSVYPYHKEFQKLVRFVRDNSESDAYIVFTKGKEIINAIEGAGINYLTEIMMTYNPKTFANMNKNPLTVLRTQGGLNIKAASTSYNGLEYAEYCEIIKEICTHLNLRNMLEADSFFNDIYWRIK